jgi:hypothetical protein
VRVQRSPFVYAVHTPNPLPRNLALMKRTVGIVVAGLIALTGCGGGTSDAAPETDPCLAANQPANALMQASYAGALDKLTVRQVHRAAAAIRQASGQAGGDVKVALVGLATKGEQARVGKPFNAWPAYQRVSITCDAR